MALDLWWDSILTFHQELTTLSPPNPQSTPAQHHEHRAVHHCKTEQYTQGQSGKRSELKIPGIASTECVSLSHYHKTEKNHSVEPLLNFEGHTPECMVNSWHIQCLLQPCVTSSLDSCSSTSSLALHCCFCARCVLGCLHRLPRATATQVESPMWPCFWREAD
jgi:hypothetical protein